MMVNLITKAIDEDFVVGYNTEKRLTLERW